ncbi:MFS transporter [Candidatus Microgenomates bacterium]|nr:MFS transporter [Candidatus Microgenomates bacterium]
MTQEQELLAQNSPHWTRLILAAFPALKHRNYRLFFVGQTTSLIGTWMQAVALSWFVFELTHSVFWVSFVFALDTLPIFFFTLPAGILADRFDKRKIFLITQTLSMIFALLLSALAHFELANLAFIIIIALLLGIFHAVEMPSRQTFIFEVVGRKDASSAIALNSGIYNAARVIGPALSGVLITLFNIQLAFFLNGISFFAVIIALLKMRIAKKTIRIHHAHPLAQIKEGVHFAFTHKAIGIFLIVIGFNSLIPWSYHSIMPAVAKNMFGAESAGYGFLLSAAGLGALIGAMLVSGFSERINVAKLIGMTNIMVAVALLFFSLISSFVLANILMFFIGLGLITQAALINASIQRFSPDYIRGRVISVYSLMFLGMMPFGSFIIGALGSILGVADALRIFGMLSIFGAFVYFFFLQPKLNGELNK